VIQGNFVLGRGHGFKEQCDFVRYCMNCTYTEYGPASSPIVKTSTNETTCYKNLETTTVEAAEYLANGTCYIYSADGGLSFAEGHVTYTRTCQSGNELSLLSVF